MIDFKPVPSISSRAMAVLMEIKCNCSAGQRIYCAERKKVIQECKNPIAAGDLGWIFAVTVKVLNSYNKINIMYDGTSYMLKFPPVPGRNKAVSYTNSCISEYLACL